MKRTLRKCQKEIVDYPHRNCRLGKNRGIPQKSDHLRTQVRKTLKFKPEERRKFNTKYKYEDNLVSK
jgi:hypothetical protein